MSGKDPRSKKQRDLQDMMDKLVPLLERELKSLEEQEQTEKQEMNLFRQLAGSKCIIANCPSKIRIIVKKKVIRELDGSILVERDDENLVLECSEGHQVIPRDYGMDFVEFSEEDAMKLRKFAKKTGTSPQEVFSKALSEFLSDSRPPEAW